MADEDYSDEEMQRFREWLGKQQEEGLRERLYKSPAPGMRPDRSIEFVRPYAPKPQPKVTKRFPSDPDDISDLHDYDYLFPKLKKKETP